MLGSALISELKKSYKTENQIAVRKYGVVVLDSSAYPTALIECGYLSNPTDAAFISSSADQDKIAQNILDAINAYASSVKNLTTTSTPSLENSSSASSDTIPSMYYKGKRIKNISVQSNSKNIKVTEPVIKVTYQDGSTETISKEEADKRGFVLPPPPPPPGLLHSFFKTNALFVIDGKISTSEKARELNPQNIQSIYVLKDEKATAKYGDKGKNGVIEIVTKNKTGNTTSVETDTNIMKVIPDDALIIIDGKRASSEKMEEIDPSSIESITVLKNQDSLLKYGVTGKRGIIKVTTKKFALSSHADTIPNKIFIKVEVAASFPGGLQAWSRFISRAISDSISKFTVADYGTCVLRFIVNTDGTVSDVVATTMQGTELAKVSINAIRKGPRWIPATQNGHTVASYRLQPVTLMNPDKKSTGEQKPKEQTSSAKSSSIPGGAIFTKLEKLASFPGGNSAWLKYITHALQKNANELIEDKNSQGVCKVQFIVSKDGRVSDIQAITKQGSKLADVAINAIENGPRWNPGIQNGREVNSFVVQPVKFFLNDNNNSITIEPL